MPTTWRENALAAAFAKLQAIAGITGLVVDRNRVDAVERFPAIVQRDGSHDVETRATGVDVVALNLEVELYARPADGTNLGTSIDELQGAVIAALLADTTLGGTVFDVELSSISGPAPDLTDSAAAQAGATVGFTLRIWAAVDDPFNLGT